MTRNANRIAEVVGAVARGAMADHGRTRVALLYDGGPEAELAARILGEELGTDLVTVDASRVAPGAVDALAQELGADRRRAEEELLRMRARLMDDALAAHPASKTALLLGGALPPEPLLPLGDLWATDVLALAGGWSAPPAVEDVARAAGGIDVLDYALKRLIDGRDAAGVEALPDDVVPRVRAMLAAGRASRRYPRIVPKLGPRTLCADLYE